MLLIDRIPLKEDVRSKTAFCFYLFAAFILVYNAIIGDMLPHYHEPPLLDPQSDPMFWLFQCSGIPQLLFSNHIIPVLFDISWAAVTLWCILSRGKQLPAILFSIYMLLYFMCRSLVYAHHGHGYIGMLFFSFAFWAQSQLRFKLLLEGLRYYTCFIFASAGCWKLWKGGLFQAGQMQHILARQHAAAFVFHQSSWRMPLIEFLVSHASLAQGILIAAVILQLAFLIGFFTRKFDKLLLLLFFAFFLGDFLLMGMSFYPTYVLGLVF